MSGVEFIIKEGSLGLFDCQTLWKKGRDGLYHLRLSKESSVSYIEKYHLQLSPIESHSFANLLKDEQVIGVWQPIIKW